MDNIDIGDVYRVSVAFADTEGVAGDPAAVTCRLKRPGGLVSVYVYGTDAEVIKSGVGSYYVDVTVNAAGGWSYRWEGVGGGLTAADEQLFYVKKSGFY